VGKEGGGIVLRGEGEGEPGQIRKLGPECLSPHPSLFWGPPFQKENNGQEGKLNKAVQCTKKFSFCVLVFQKENNGQEGN
jgi:hypothetical protein